MKRRGTSWEADARRMCMRTRHLHLMFESLARRLYVEKLSKCLKVPSKLIANSKIAAPVVPAPGLLVAVIPTLILACGRRCVPAPGLPRTLILACGRRCRWQQCLRDRLYSHSDGQAVNSRGDVLKSYAEDEGPRTSLCHWWKPRGWAAAMVEAVSLTPCCCYCCCRSWRTAATSSRTPCTSARMPCSARSTRASSVETAWMSSFGFSAFPSL